MASKKKSFDAIAASRGWRRATSREVRGLTSEERIAFFNRSLETKPAASATSAARKLASR